MSKQLLYLRVNITKKCLPRQISTNVYPFWQKWGLSKLKKGKQMLTSLVNKCLLAYWVNKQGGIYNIPLFTQVFTLMDGQRDKVCHPEPKENHE